MRLLASAALVLALAACSDAAVDVEAPPAAGTEQVCRALVAALPDRLDPGVDRRRVRPDTGRTAAWGDPPVTLQCGVGENGPADPPFAVNGVVFTTKDVGAATRWTTYGRTVPVSVTIPDGYGGGELVLALVDAVRTVPEDPAVPDPLATP